MKLRDRQLRWLRRGTALALAAAAVGSLRMTAGWDAAGETLAGLLDRPALVIGLLSAELGHAPDPTGGLGALAQTVVNQSALLSTGALATDYLSGSRAPEEETQAEAPDEEALPQTEQTQPVEQTLTGVGGDGYLETDGLAIKNETAKTIDLAAYAQTALSLRLQDASAGPQILIMHTHGSEAYTADGADVYVPSDTARTTDERYNMIRVGEEIKTVLEGMGLSVVHDTTLYDYPSYTGSYSRSREGIERYLAQYPTIQIVLDVHRDALVGSDGTAYKVVTTVGEEKTAQVMLVVGTDEGGQSHPNWEQNFALALHIQSAMGGISETLARPVDLRASRFNQQLTQGSLLVEVGSHGNTLQEALAGARRFAQAAGQVCLSLVET